MAMVRSLVVSISEYLCVRIIIYVCYFNACKSTRPKLLLKKCSAMGPDRRRKLNNTAAFKWFEKNKISRRTRPISNWEMGNKKSKSVNDIQPVRLLHTGTTIPQAFICP